MNRGTLERNYDFNLLRQNYAAPFASGASRREFLRTLAAAGAGALLPGSGLLAQANRPALGRIDVHHHMIPPFYVKAMEAIRGPRTSTATEPWKPSVSLDEMDKNGVTTAMLSLTQ